MFLYIWRDSNDSKIPQFVQTHYTGTCYLPQQNVSAPMGGTAAVTASELVVHPETDASHMFHLNLTTPGCLASWTFLADAINRHGAVASVELSHSGQYAGTYLVDKDKKKGLNQYGPSDWVRPDGIQVKALTKEQIQDIVKAYGDTAGLAKRAGFQMVMVHGGHGWQIRNCPIR